MAATCLVLLATAPLRRHGLHWLLKAAPGVVLRQTQMNFLLLLNRCWLLLTRVMSTARLWEISQHLLIQNLLPLTSRLRLYLLALKALR
jgi:hypothetical protein